MLLVNKSIDVDFEAPLDGSLMTYSSVVRADNLAFNLRIERDHNILMLILRRLCLVKCMNTS